MRILIVSTFFPPLNSIASHRSYSWAKYWAQEGHDVTVLTTTKPKELSDLSLPNQGFKVWEVAPPTLITSLKTNYQQSKKNGSDINENWWKSLSLKFFHYLRHQKGVFNASRMPDFMDLWIKPALKALPKEEKWDLVVSTAGPYSVHFVAAKIKKRGAAKKWVADFRDLWTDNHVFPGLFPFNIFEGWIEKQLLRRADALTIVSPVWAEILGRRHGSERVHVIENGFDPEDLAQLPPTKIFPEDGKVRLIHTGKFYPDKQNVEILFRAIKQLLDNSHTCSLSRKLEIIFAGPELDYIQQLTKIYGLEGIVQAVGFVKRSLCLAMQRDAHALLFFPWSETSGSGIGLMSGKIYEYLFSQTPILAIGGQKEQSAQKLLTEVGAGEVVDNLETLVHHLQALLQQGTKKISSVPSNNLEKYTRKQQALELLRTIESSS